MNNKEKIISIIGKKSCGLTAKNVFENLENIDKTTVYRNLEKLSNSGELIEEFSKTGEKKYSLKKIHHHHFICDICKKEINIGCKIDELIKTMEQDFGFEVKNHSFVLNGICENCKK